MRKLSDIRSDWEKSTPGPWETIVEMESDGIAKTEPISCMVSGLNRFFWDAEWADESEWEQSIANAEAIANAPTDVIGLLDWVSKAIPHLKDYGQMLDSRIPGLDYIPDPDIAEEDKTINVISRLLKEIEG